MARTPSPWYWKERGGWYVTVDGKRYCLARGTLAKTKKEASLEFHRLMSAKGRVVQSDPIRMTVLDLFDLYLVALGGEVKKGARTEDSRDYYAKHLSSAARVAGGTRVADVSPRIFLAWADRDTWGPSTQSVALSVVKAAFGWAAKVGHIQSNPLAGMEVPAMGVREAIPTRAQVELMKSRAWGQPFKDYLAALVETGCRPSEVMTLTADRADVEGGTWAVLNKTRNSTGEKFRPVYLNEAMIEMTRRLLAKHPEGLIFRNSRGGQWTKRVIADRFIRLRKRCGLGKECTAYSLRHLYITDALERGVPPATVAQLVGHKSLTMIMKHYNKLRTRTDHLREAARHVRPSSDPPPHASPR